jgi:uncharacterized membrane protein YkgB
MQQVLPRFQPINRIDATVTQWLTRHSVTLVRASLGFVFLAFGVLKFVPDVSPAEDIAVRTTEALTLGIVEGDLARLFVAAMETTIGLSLLTGRYLRAGIALLGIAMVGVLSPLALFPGDLFAGDYNAPTLEGQYVLKDIVLLASGLVVGLRQRGAEMMIVPADGMAGDRHGGGAV